MYGEDAVERPIRWAYGAPVEDFLRADPEAILGGLVVRSWADITPLDRGAWVGQISVLQRELVEFSGRGSIYLEFDVPRLGRRIDTVVVLDHALFVIEFKVGAVRFSRAAVDQVWDYALDLKYFHSSSLDLPIVPVVVATEANGIARLAHAGVADGVLPPIGCSGSTLREALLLGLGETSGLTISASWWESGRYQPTPTIVEAARVLYAGHGVTEITRNDAGAENLAVTSNRVSDLIRLAELAQKKIICFVTGVPGAGKTLVGLDVATRQAGRADRSHSVFLSGNGPLVAVLQAALARDEVRKRELLGERLTVRDAARKVKTFIQNIHHFRDEYYRDRRPPINNVVLFDEAQRAWDHKTTSVFMQAQHGDVDFRDSEPEFLISCMDRHEWAVIVCLVGMGQEINKGEAGIGAWLAAIKERFPHWHVHVSPCLVNESSLDTTLLSELESVATVQYDPSLHLASSVRSFRADQVSSFVNDFLDLRLDEARAALKRILVQYPVFLGRDLSLAKRWLRSKARGSERFGIVVSSGAQRLRPLGVDVRVKTDPVPWFLSDAEDVRSSYFLEDPATEFQIQGLELDWTCVVWDGDLRFEDDAWSFHKFQGSKWKRVVDERRRRYLLNAYRVLLTRARQGMVIVVPEGDSEDWTRPPRHYDAVFELLLSLGIPELSGIDRGE
ncbi:DUF2075 domain-containing protein [Lysobacter sp. KIS68-7]|uniref:DUF2075 domain-containing protein n=1 Tax=Lysobacter sp. KIS68-7 TaxID=2904252 RepID=UPI001E455C30|nr:DUF2075 domain-containing protein [Lysobacter sp. KIS68-7]UHQ20670.1 DUF2075 domain-containing protein [Lysobacter sp. KIS68-7]